MAWPVYTLVLLLWCATASWSQMAYVTLDNVYPIFHHSGNTIPLFGPTQDTIVNVTMCLARGTFQLPCTQGFDMRRSRCAVVTTDCKCYDWLSDDSNDVCVSKMVRVTDTEAVFSYSLIHLVGQVAATDGLLGFYFLWRLQYPDLAFDEFMEAMCESADSSTALQPPVSCQFQYRIPFKWYPPARMEAPSGDIAIGMVLAGFIVMWFIGCTAFVRYSRSSKKQA